MTERPLSPCKDICALGASVSVCTGCGRTVAEIAELGERDCQPPARNRAAIFCPLEKPRFTDALKNLTPERIQSGLHL